MSLAWMTVDHRREDWPRIRPSIKSRASVARCYLRTLWRLAAGFVAGLALGPALFHLIQARAESERRHRPGPRSPACRFLVVRRSIRDGSQYKAAR
jgi:hypothetical protein